jgi:Tfp pilus assembly protein PilX
MRLASIGSAGREGFATAVTLLIILVLAIIGLGAAWLATTEKKTSFAESVHLSALYSADSGGESAINYLRLVQAPPAYSGTNRTVRALNQTVLEGSQSYDFTCNLCNNNPLPAMSPAVGWGSEYRYFNYRVTADGWASREGRSAVRLLASRLFRVGSYN